MTRVFALAVALIVASASAFAQTTPNWSYNYVPAASEWNSILAGKQDFGSNLSANPVTASGGGGTFSLSGWMQNLVQTQQTLIGLQQQNALAGILGTAQGPVLGVWPNLYFAPSPTFEGTPLINGSNYTAQIEFMRNGSSYTFVGATNTTVGLSSSEALPFEVALNGYQVFFHLDPTTGNAGIGTISPTSKLDVNGNSIRVETAYTPPLSTTACSIGTIAWDSSYIYVCVAANTWKKSLLSTW